MNVNTILKTKGTAVDTITTAATIAEVANRLRDRNVGALVVSDDGASVSGIISERDIIRALAMHGPRTLEKRASELMTANVHTCTPDDTVGTIMAAMTEHRIRHMPVLAEEKLCGIVSIGDVVKMRLAEIESEASALRDYIASG